MTIPSVKSNHSKIEKRPDVLESVLWDAEGLRISGPALVGFVVSEVKARIHI